MEEAQEDVEVSEKSEAKKEMEDSL